MQGSREAGTVFEAAPGGTRKARRDCQDTPHLRRCKPAGTKDVVPFIKYLLGTILAAYKDFEDRVALVETKLPALEMVRRASKNRIGRFNKQDIRELCLTLSDSSIEGALRKLVAAGELKKEGKGKNTCYFRLN